MPGTRGFSVWSRGTSDYPNAHVFLRFFDPTAFKIVFSIYYRI